MSIINLKQGGRIRISDLSTRIIFYEYRPAKGPTPKENEYKEVYSCWGKVDTVWLKDMERAKTNGTLSDITLTIRDPLREFIPTNKHFIKIDTFDFKDFVYNVESTQPNLQNRGFISIVGKLKD